MQRVRVQWRGSAAGKRLIAAIAAAALFGPAVTGILGAHPQPFENRPRSPAPSVNDGWVALDKATPWAADSLPGRAQAVHANAWLRYRLFGAVSQTFTMTNTAAGGGLTRSLKVTPTVVRGRDGYLFLGEDFTRACERSADSGRSLKSIAELVDIIRASGRRVVFTVAPDKSSVAMDEVPGTVPRGTCAMQGIRRTNRILDEFSHPGWIALRRPLFARHRSGERVYWRTDSHWSGLGAARYAQALAERLDPELSDVVKLVPGVETKAGDLTRLGGRTSRESGPAPTVSVGATVIPSKGTAAYDASRPVYTPAGWVTLPDDALVKGRSLLLGDSFTYYALRSVQPLFARGTFLWLGHVSQASIVFCDRIGEDRGARGSPAIDD